MPWDPEFTDVHRLQVTYNMDIPTASGLSLTSHMQVTKDGTVRMTLTAALNWPALILRAAETTLLPWRVRTAVPAPQASRETE